MSDGQKGILVILSGFSGSGKGTVMKRLLEKYDNYALSVSATTREPRPGETDGVDYFFKSEEEFSRMVEEDAFLEHARYVSHSYGTPKAYVDEQLAAGKDVLLEIEIQGAMKVKEKRPDTALIFLTPPSAEELRRRLTGRGTESDEVIEARMKRAVEESESMGLYDYILVNDEVDRCADELHQLVQNLHKQVSHQKGFIEEIQRELKAMQ